MSHHSAYGEGKRRGRTARCAFTPGSSGSRRRSPAGSAFVGPHLPLDARYAIGNFIRDGLARRADRRAGRRHAAALVSLHRRHGHLAVDHTLVWQIVPAVQCRFGRGDFDCRVGPLVADSFRPRPEVRILESPTPGKPAERYVPSTRRASEELGTAAADRVCRRPSAGPSIGTPQVTVTPMRGESMTTPADIAC